MNPTVLVNGEPVGSVAASDRGFQYGDGVFTTLPVRQGVPGLFRRHLARLARDARRLLIPSPNSDELTRDVGVLMATRPDGVLKIQITRGQGGRGYEPPETVHPTRVVALHPLPDYPQALRAEGVEVRICRVRLGQNSILAGLKHMNRLEQVMARAEWRPGVIREGIMQDVEGHVTEGTRSNLFLVRHGVLVTPRLDLCGVAGVMRELVLEGAGELGLVVEERRVALEELLAADEAFLTNSVIGLWPIRRLERREFPVGPVARLVDTWVTARIRDESATWAA